MSAFKWSLLFLLVIFPLFLLTGDYMAHNTAASDANTAARNAAQAAIKANIVKVSLRDSDVYKDNIVVQYNPETIQTTFNQSFTRNVQTSNGNKAYLTVAEGANIAGAEIHTVSSPYPTGISGFEAGGRGSCPPMLAIRSNTVRVNVLYDLLHQFAPVSPYDVIQTQKIAILEAK